MKRLFNNDQMVKSIFILGIFIGLFTSCEKTTLEPMVYKVMFNTDGGSKLYSIAVNAREKAVMPANPTKRNCTFSYWFQTDTLTAFNFETTPITTSITLNAKWLVSSCDVAFDTKGGSTIDTINVPINSVLTKPQNPIKLNGQGFDRWFSDAELTIPYDFSAPVTKDIILYAGWKSQNLIVNGNFETAFTVLTPTDWGQGIRAAYIPGWDKKPGVTTIDPTTYNNSGVCEWPTGADVFILVKDGSKVFGLMPFNWGSQPAGDVALEQTIAVEPGKTYSFTCKTMIGQPDAGNAVISFIKVFVQGSTTSAVSATSPAGATVGTWYNLSTSYLTPEGCTSIVVKVGQTYPTRSPWNAFNNRWAYFDDVIVKED